MISARIQESLARGIRGEAAQIKAFAAFLDAYKKRWRARTVCAPEYAIERCSNVPEPTA